MADPPARLQVFGIRHHGPGSARSLGAALTRLRPAVILIEGPAELEPLLPLVLHPAMQPPVAALFYAENAPSQAAFYPFAEFSPEWQAMRYGMSNNIPVRFIDLPQTHQLITTDIPDAPVDGAVDSEEQQTPDPLIGLEESQALQEMTAIHSDPISYLAQLAGQNDGERWWERLVETRSEAGEVFAAILLAMTALRERVTALGRPVWDEREAKREAFMRQSIRAAEKDVATGPIAVVCGAWHAPVLADMAAFAAKDDAALLKNLPKTKVLATWIPWTYGRLARASGYGAGVTAPGWYAFLHQNLGASSREITVRWLVQMARLLRGQDLDASSAHVIEAVRLSEMLATLRGQPLPGLTELSEAARSVFLWDSDAPMQLIEQQLLIGEQLGTVPPETPSVPLQRDLEAQLKRLRLKLSADSQDLDLDLRKENELGRSLLFHRLNIIGVEWAKIIAGTNKQGTFRESWRLQWQPEFTLRLIEASRYGQSIEEAANNRCIEQSHLAQALPALTDLLKQTSLARLPLAGTEVLRALEIKAATTSDIGHLMKALPALATTARYSDVRQTKSKTVILVMAGILTRINIGLPLACASLDDQAATMMVEHLQQSNAAIALLQDPAWLSEWQATLDRLSQQQGVHGLLQGKTTRLLLDGSVLEASETARRLGLAVAVANDPKQAAYWIEGFVGGSGLVLLHDDSLLALVDLWLLELTPEAFTQVVPLLRRAFSSFSAGERRNIGEKIKSGGTQVRVTVQTADSERADLVLPVVAALLGLEMGG
jgi:hypothetical protein